MYARRTLKLIETAAICVCIFLVSLQTSRADESSNTQHRPKVLMFAAISISHLADSVQHWSEKAGVSGFFIDNVANWWSSRDALFEKLQVLTEVNARGARYGVDSNFLKVALGYGKLPNWMDDEKWANVVKTFGDISDLANRSGSRGIAIDTEAYSIPLLDTRDEPYKEIRKDLLRAKVYQRGREIMLAMATIFPDVEVIVLPEGAFYWANPEQGSSPDSFELWIDFWNGMASVNNKNGIIIGAERTYSVLNSVHLSQVYAMERNTMQEHVQDKAFWMNKCSIAIGMWPLGKSYEDKAARYTPAQFRDQFLAAVALSPRYVWIYGHGAAWWQLTAEEIKKHSSAGGMVWSPKSQLLPVDSAIDKYFAVIREGK